MYEKKILPNGVRLLSEQIPNVRTAALGIWVTAGSRLETAAESGAAHFIEHMSFKGTERRSAVRLAEEMDAIGGQMNAYTTKEETSYYTWVLDTHLAQATDILWDMLFHSKFDEQDMETERGVILEEIGMYNDNPEDLCAERLAAAVYQGSPLARPILGRKASLNHLNGDRLRAWHDAHYVPSALVVALAGNFSKQDLTDLEGRFSSLKGAAFPPPLSGKYTPSFTVKKRAIEQNHITLAFPGLTTQDKQRFTLQLLSSILGGSVSSRLWQRVREESGLCYSIFSYGASYQDIGLFVIYTATSAETEEKALRAILEEIRRFREDGVTQEELDRAREQSKTKVLIGLESTQARMNSLGRSEISSGEILTPQQVIQRYDAVTREDIQTLAQKVLDVGQISFSAVGRTRPVEDYRELLKTGSFSQSAD